jgi:hypothetical protein
MEIDLEEYEVNLTHFISFIDKRLENQKEK